QTGLTHYGLAKRSLACQRLINRGDMRGESVLSWLDTILIGVCIIRVGSLSSSSDEALSRSCSRYDRSGGLGVSVSGRGGHSQGLGISFVVPPPVFFCLVASGAYLGADIRTGGAIVSLGFHAIAIRYVDVSIAIAPCIVTYQ